MTTRTFYLGGTLTDIQLAEVRGKLGTINVFHNWTCEIPCITIPIRTSKGRTINKMRNLLKKFGFKIVSEE